VGPRTSLEGCGIYCPHRDLIPGPSSLWQVTIPTELLSDTNFQHLAGPLLVYFYQNIPKVPFIVLFS